MERRVYRKLVEDRTIHSIENEILCLKRASYYGIAPHIFYSDRLTYIDMERIDGKTVKELYGEEISAVPSHILHNIFNLLEILYYKAGVEYPDVNPRNFIIKHNIIWTVNFSKARMVKVNVDMCTYLSDVFNKGKIHNWTTNI